MKSARLSDEQKRILEEKHTEKPFSSKLLVEKRKGVYYCIKCGNMLFNSETKFDSGSGWPSFYEIADSDSVNLKEDDSFGMKRTEVTCGKCGGHLGHLFLDGPLPTGKRFCINGKVLDFFNKEAEKKKK